MESRLERIRAAQAAASKIEGEKPAGRKRITAQVISATPVSGTDEQTREKTVPVQGRASTGDSSTTSDSSSDSDAQVSEALEPFQKPQRPLLKPVFIPRNARAADAANSAVDSEPLSFVSERIVHKAEQREEARQLVADVLRRDYEAELKAATGNVSGVVIPDPNAGVFDPASVDDTDDPEHFEEEYLAWKLRELLRIKAEKDERERWDREKAELERIRNMTEEERRQIDAEKASEWEAQPQSQYKFLQKYYHKGAFFQEEHSKLLARDYAEATGADRSSKDILPAMMQVRDFGKKGRSKWAHLTAEDTTAFDYGWGAKDNTITAKTVSKMGGMRGDLDHPSKRSKK
jgi:microfibrillar-associated protein 1